MLKDGRPARKNPADGTKKSHVEKRTKKSKEVIPTESLNKGGGSPGWAKWP